MFKELGAVKYAIQLLRVGHEIKDAVRLKQAQTLASLLVVAIGAVAGIAAAFGHPLNLTEAAIEQLGSGLAGAVLGLVAVFNVLCTVLSSNKIGLLPAKPADPVSQGDTGQPGGVSSLQPPAPTGAMQQPGGGPERGADPAPAPVAAERPDPGYIHLDATSQYLA